MKGADAGSKGTEGKARPRVSKTPARGRIHPVVMYPYRQPEDGAHLEELFRRLGDWGKEVATFARPLTVMDRKTHFRMAQHKRFLEFREGVVRQVSDLMDAWCVDTCQMWYAGLGTAFERGAPGDVYWLIPGDFDYGSATGQEVLARLVELPAICQELEQDVCVGEIATDHTHSKQLIDTHGTFALLYNWFPGEGREIRQFTERPRSEFFAINHAFLGEMLQRRWYAYEQTLVILLHAVFGRRRITRYSVGHVSDLPEGRESLAAAMQQIERCERVLKSLWRERHGARTSWIEQFRRLESQSDQIRRAAFVILEKALA